MEFRFRAGERGPSSSSASGGSPPAGLSTPREGHLGAPGVQGPLPPPSAELEAARREDIIQKEVRRRLIEEEVRREFEAKGDLAFAHGHHAGFLPNPFLVPGLFIPPWMPMPMPMHLPLQGPPPMPMHPPPRAPPPMPFDEFGSWPPPRGPPPMPFDEFGSCPPPHTPPPMPFDEFRAWPPPHAPPPRPKPTHKLQLLEIEPSGGPEALLSETKVPSMKRKADTIVGLTVPKKVQKITKDWSCALCQVSFGTEAALNEHLEGRKHKAKLSQCGASMVIRDDKNNSWKVTGNKSVTDPCDAPMKISILVDGVMHEVVQRNKYMWCDPCKVWCYSNSSMAGHLRGKKHSEINKFCTSIEAVRMNTEGLTCLCENKLNTNESTEVPVVMKGNVDMAMQVDECGAVENPVEVEKEESTSMASEVESTNTATKVHVNIPVETPVETLKGSTDMTNDVSQLLPKEE